MAVADAGLVADQARWLLNDADPGDWSVAALERVAAGRDWGARVVPVGEVEERYSEGRGARELVLGAREIPGPGRTAESNAAAFGKIGTVLEENLGPASSLGSHGLIGPWGEAPPSWGSPFRQWRRVDRTLELRSNEGGCDLVLFPTGPFEAWRQAQHEWSDQPTGGFIITRDVPGNDGLFLPGVPRAKGWKQLEPMWAAFLGRLPAETAALTRPLQITIYAGTGAKMPISSGADGALSVRTGFRHVADPAALGWTRISAPVFPWQLDAGGPGRVDGDGLAGTLIGSLREEKIKTPGRLSVTCAGDDHTVLYGMGLGPDLFRPVG